MVRKHAVACAAVLVLTACATNPQTGEHHVVLSSAKSDQESARKIHEEVIKFYGQYADQHLQDYVQSVGTRVALQTPIADWDFKFFVLDDDELNAFTTGGSYVYVHRGLLAYLKSKAELAAGLGHTMGHIVARHTLRTLGRSV